MGLKTYLRERKHELREQYILTRDPQLLVREDECIKIINKMDELDYEFKLYQKHYQAEYRRKKKEKRSDTR